MTIRGRARVGQSLLFDEYPLIVSPTLATELGLTEAIILQQMHFWLGRSKHHRDGKTWIYNTYAEWKEQLPFLSERTIRRTIKTLEDRGLIETTAEYNKMKMDRTKWYTISYDALDRCLPTGHNDIPSGQIGRSKGPARTHTTGQIGRSNNHRLPETTTETTRDEDESDKWHDPLRVWSDNGGQVLNGYQAQKLDYYQEDMERPVLVEAVKETLQRTTRFQYLLAILDAWRAENIRTMEDLNRHRDERKRGSKETSEEDELDAINKRLAEG